MTPDPLIYIYLEEEIDRHLVRVEVGISVRDEF